MQRAKNFVPSALFALLFLMLALAPFLVTGCSREEEEPAIEQAAPVTEPEPAAKAYVLGDVVPVTRDMLALMPESATAAVALPPMNGLLNKGVALAKRILPPEMDVDEWVKLLIADAAADAGVPDAKSIEEVAMAKGLDISSPIAVFADFASAAASAKVAIGAMGETVAASPEATSADAVNQGVAGPTGAQVEAAMEEVTIPDLVGVVGCINTELAVASLREILESEGSSIDLSKMEEIDAKGVMISFTEEGPFGYFTTDDLLVVGNSLALLQETAVRVDAPVPVRYGSTECPASEPDEIVALARADKLLPMLQDLLPALIAMNPQMASIAKMQMATLNKYAEAFTGDDPLVMTIAWTDDIIEMRSRTDLSKHPGLTEVIGEIKPLKLAPMLPEGTLLMIAQQFNEETKEQIEQSWMASLPPEMQSSPEFAGISEIVEKVIKLVDDE
ncbi:MAG: hypothetical protein GWP08_07470, partial [Nitrospiraceae bacterium]|nr:hypothetical protein [Nitrospiraceae bacterium]